MISERYDLAIGRIREIPGEDLAKAAYNAYFHNTARFLMLLDRLKMELSEGTYAVLKEEGLKKWNHTLYEDILPENYGTSYANPSYAVEKMGRDFGQILSFLYTELRGGIAYAFEGQTEYLAILYELFIEIYNCFEQEEEPAVTEIKEIIYWYASDYCDVFAAGRILEQVNPDKSSFALNIIMNSDLSDLRYLYRYGEYISGNELGTAKHLNSLPLQVIQKMADVYTEGYRMGFMNTRKDLSKKLTVHIRYVLGFERVIRMAVENFAKMGLKPLIYRSAVSVLTKRQQLKTGYYGGSPNKQYEYDHRNDQGLFLDKRFIERKLQVIQNVYEMNKDLSLGHAGPAVMDVFGEEPFAPVQKEDAIRLTGKQESLAMQYASKSGQITNRYIPGDERSFTIIAYPVPEIGADYGEIFDEVIRINTLDNQKYTDIQQKIIDTLDLGDSVRIIGGNGNRTDLTVKLFVLTDPAKQTIFENCVSDVNIPAGEVFTSPVLEGTNGLLHVRQVYLKELMYRDLEITFKDGMITDYRCGNFEQESEGRKYIFDNIMNHHPTLPLGEFAIGTNTTAYVVAKKYGIEDKLPVLIAEKMGPHFAVGDTCYSWSEENRIFNPDGKEIVAKDNAVSLKRKEDVSKAYFQCHTDITIPYDELYDITVTTREGKEIPIIRDGEFVLPGTEALNVPLKKLK